MHYCSHLVTKVALLIQTGLGYASELHYTECSLLSYLGRGLVLCFVLQGLPWLQWFIAVALICIIFCAHQRLHLSGSRCVNIVNAAQSL